MASKRRQRRRGCDGKKRYATMGAAIEGQRRYRAKNPEARMDAYRCSNCGSYHFGHMPARVAAAIEERRAIYGA